MITTGYWFEGDQGAIAWFVAIQRTNGVPSTVCFLPHSVFVSTIFGACFHLSSSFPPLRGKTSGECEEEFLDLAQEEGSYGALTYTVQVGAMSTVPWFPV